MIHGLSWCPNVTDNFVTWGPEVNLYKVQENSDAVRTNSSIELSPHTYASLLASETRYQYVRCMAPSYSKEVLVAIGLASGKVSLCNFDSINDHNMEFTPRQQRTCLCLAWNEVEPNLLAIGHDRNRSDYCITIWDVDRGIPKEPSSLIGLGDTAHSLCWDKINKLLVAGVSQKSIKLYDTRQSNTNCASIQTKLVYGLCVSPSGRYLASYVDTVVGIWDLRNIDKPLTQIQTLKNITNLTWCPTRTSVVSAIQRDSPLCHMIEVHCTDIDDGCDIYSTKRLLAPFQTRNTITSKISTLHDFSWHPTNYERALFLSDTGRIIDYTIPIRKTIQWDPRNNLSPECDDIAKVINRRALNDYGLENEIKKNGDVAQNPTLKSVWNLLANMARDGQLIGLKKILGVSSAADGPPMSKSECDAIQWPDFSNSCSFATIYKSEQREFAQCLCGWTFENNFSVMLNKFIPSLCSRKEFSRAAMICTFYMKIKEAIDILSKAATDQNAASTTYRLAAIALTGFNADRSKASGENQRPSAFAQINDPYLRTIFAFLSSDSDNYDTVINEKEISLADRMAFACRYLSDSKLAELVKNTIQNCIENGDLHGLLLTGESKDGINLLQSYLDWTEDIQTVSLLAIRFFPSEVHTEPRFKYWIETYRDLLDTWELWEKRAEFDIKMESLQVPPKISRSVFVLCNFCGKSVSSALQDDVRMRSAAANPNKLSSCPNCRKPLPRCSLCLLHMGTTTATSLHGTSAQNNVGWKSKAFSKWFSWCQTCRHGGHTEHLMEWFSTNPECPVTACSCKCFSLDFPIPPLKQN